MAKGGYIGDGQTPNCCHHWVECPGNMQCTGPPNCQCLPPLPPISSDRGATQGPSGFFERSHRWPQKGRRWFKRPKRLKKPRRPIPKATSRKFKPTYKGSRGIGRGARLGD